eukprot:scaffold31815_cov118-Isochrysis_galbana.AAC.25
MEQTPADARAAPSASVPKDVDMGIASSPKNARVTQRRTIRHLGSYLYLIAWRFIITDFYQLHYDNELPPFDEANAYSIYMRTIERYTTLVMARAYKIRAIIHTRERSGATHPQRLLNRANRVSPSARVGVVKPVGATTKCSSATW